MTPPVHSYIRELGPKTTRPRLGRIGSPVAIVGLAVPFHIALAIGTDLSPDEAYYLASSRFGSIVDHPPLTGWLVGVAAGWPIPLELQVRWPAIACTAVAALALARLAGRVCTGTAEEQLRAGQIAAFLATWLMLPAAGGFLMTPDVPAAIGWISALAWAAAPERRINRSIVTAWLVAFGALAKVSVLPAALVAAACLALRRRREGPLHTWPRICLPSVLWLTPLGLVMPTLAPSLWFQIRHAFFRDGASFSGSPAQTSTGTVGLVASAMGSSAAALVASALGCALLFSPPVVYFGLKSLSRLPAVFRATAAVFSVLVVTSALLRGQPAEPNWWLPVALPLMVAASVGLASSGSRKLAATLLVAAVPTLIAMAHAMHPFLPIATRMDPTARLHGWSKGQAPLGAPGIGEYAQASERCAYQGDCAEISMTIKNMSRPCSSSTSMQADH